MVLTGDRMKVSLVIPSVDRSAALYNLLKHLEHQTYPDFEMIVVEQSDAVDARVEKYAREHPRVILVRPGRRSLPLARNAGIRRASGAIVLFIDDDVIPDPDMIRAHVMHYKDPQIGVVGGRITGGYDRTPSERRVGEFNPWTGKVSRNFNSGTARMVDHLPGGNMSFRREVFERAGVFDEQYGGASSIGEETDFCLRAHRAGFRFIYEPAAALEHLHLPTGGCRHTIFSDWLFWQAHNTMLFALRHMKRMSLPVFILQRFIRLGLFSCEHGDPLLVPIGLKGMMRAMSLNTRLGASPPHP